MDWQIDLSDERSWQIADEGWLTEQEQLTFEAVDRVVGAMERIILMPPPYASRQPPRSLQKHQDMQFDPVARDMPALATRLNAIREIEEILASRYAPQELQPCGSIDRHIGRSSIWRGYLDKRLTVPLFERIAPDVLYFIEKIPGVGDLLKRENHAHFGIHYHYLNIRRRRSDTVLCFVKDAPWPLFAEKHAVGAAEFQARPGGWSKNKRVAVYDLLGQERRRFPGGPFRPPSNGASLVWQEDAVNLKERRNGTKSLVLRNKQVVELI